MPYLFINRRANKGRSRLMSSGDIDERVLVSMNIPFSIHCCLYFEELL